MHARAPPPAQRETGFVQKTFAAGRENTTAAQGRRARYVIARAPDRLVDQPPLSEDIGVEADGGIAVDEADGAAVEAAGIVAVEDDIGAVASGAGAVAAGAAMVDDAAGFSLLSPLLPPHAASPTTNAEATTIRVSFMGSLRAVGCQYLARSLKRELHRAATAMISRSDGRNFRQRISRARWRPPWLLRRRCTARRRPSSRRVSAVR